MAQRRLEGIFLSNFYIYLLKRKKICQKWKTVFRETRNKYTGNKLNVRMRKREGIVLMKFLNNIEC